MSLESFSRLSQSIVDAARTTDSDAAQKAASLVVNSVGQHSLPKRPAIRQTQFDQAVDVLGDAIKAVKDSRKTEKADSAKTESKTGERPTLAELLTQEPK